MALVNGLPITATSTAVKVGTPKESRTLLGISGPAGGATVYIGGSNVTTANGIPIVGGNVVWMTRDALSESSAMSWFVVCATSQVITLVEGS